jgi:YggT family protein
VVIVCWVLTIYLVVLAARAVLSWFPTSPGGVLEQIQSVLFAITEPVLRPARQLIPPLGMFDLSFIAVFFVIVILRSVLC